MATEITQILITCGVLLFIALLIWSQFEHKPIKEVIFEIRDILKDMGK